MKADPKMSQTRLPLTSSKVAISSGTCRIPDRTALFAGVLSRSIRSVRRVWRRRSTKHMKGCAMLSVCWSWMQSTTAKRTGIRWASHPAGNTVVLKPNFVRHFRETQAGHEDCLITHGAVIRAALDYAYIALQGRGRIIIADAPQNDADFDEIRRMAGVDEIRSSTAGTHISTWRYTIFGRRRRGRSTASSSVTTPCPATRPAT